YILEHADMPGFSNDDQQLLALFALGHHGKISKLPTLEPARGRRLTLLCLRLAVLLSRRREDQDQLPVTITPNGKGVTINVDREWLASHPLSEYSLQAEKREWNKAGFELEVAET